MDKGLVAKAEIVIKASPAKVWEALTKPELIKQYLFGTEAVSDWRAGSPIAYKGVWQGTPYEDKGQVLRAEPGRLLASTYWSSMSGLPDAPENYNTVTYELTPADGGTKLTVTQDNNSTEESRGHSEKNWTLVLQGLKRLLES
jgi:uncharacterized protein YndB with AHSA1/START domain